MDAQNRHAAALLDVTAPAVGAFVVTPSDNTDLARPIRAVTLGAAGTLSYIAWNGAACTTGTLPAGTYPLCATRILAAGTSATGLTGWV